jgi:hypothetical protein
VFIFNDDNFFQRIAKPNAVLKFLKNSNHMPYIIELQGENPVIIDLLNSLIPLAQKIKNPKSEIKRKLCDLIAMLIASQMGKADVMAQELFIRESVNNFDKIFDPILKESNYLD